MFSWRLGHAPGSSPENVGQYALITTSRNCWAWSVLRVTGGFSSLKSASTNARADEYGRPASMTAVRVGDRDGRRRAVLPPG
jgi:hypothetical protein